MCAPEGPKPVKVEVRRVTPELERDLARAKRLAKLLDTRFSVAGIRFGWDSIVGLVPVAGDIATAALSLYPIYLAGRHELGSVTIARMLGNVGLDVLVGLVPVVGDLFDIAWKANHRNLLLFQKAIERRHRSG